ncbi:MAG TPA: hypothetical protein DD727_00010 [Clostridiales bacterium]|nr:hypothetical protein [Clostridiales bacterium]
MDTEARPDVLPVLPAAVVLLPFLLHEYNVPRRKIRVKSKDTKRIFFLYNVLTLLNIFYLI